MCSAPFPGLKLREGIRGGSGDSHLAPHHVPLPESPDAATVADSSGNGHDGTVAGVTLGVDGKYGKAAQFTDTSGSEIEVADAASLELGSGDFTIEAWVYAWNVTGTDTIASKWTVGADPV